jgi:hypothetical protein
MGRSEKAVRVVSDLRVPLGWRLYAGSIAAYRQAECGAYLPHNRGERYSDHMTMFGMSIQVAGQVCGELLAAWQPRNELMGHVFGDYAAQKAAVWGLHVTSWKRIATLSRGDHNACWLNTMECLTLSDRGGKLTKWCIVSAGDVRGRFGWRSSHGEGSMHVQVFSADNIELGYSGDRLVSKSAIVDR